MTNTHCGSNKLTTCAIATAKYLHSRFISDRTSLSPLSASAITSSKSTGRSNRSEMPLHERPFAGDGFQAAAPAAMAFSPVGNDRNMAHFAGEPAVAREKQMIDHHAQADAGAHIEHGEAIEIAGFAIHVFGQAQGVRIVNQHAIGVEHLAQVLAEFLAVQKTAGWRPGEFPAGDSRRVRRR